MIRTVLFALVSLVLMSAVMAAPIPDVGPPPTEATAAPPAPAPVVTPAPAVVIDPLSRDALMAEVDKLKAENAALEKSVAGVAEEMEVVPAAIAAVSATRDASKAPTLASIAAAVSAVLWCLIAAVRKWGGVFLSGQRVRIITLVAIPLATVAGSLAAGLPVFEALVLAMSGPGALLLNELKTAVAPNA